MLFANHDCRHSWITILSRASTHTRASAHPPILIALWFFGVLHVTAHHAKFSRSEPEVGPLSPQLQLFWCTLGDTTSGIKGSYTPVRGLVCSILRLQHEICILQVTTECCGNLATRLQVGPLCSTIQLSPLSGWPQWITDEPTMQVHSVLWQLTVHPGWALAWG